MNSAPLSPTERSTVRRGAHRASTDRADLIAILDEALVCHLGVVVDGAPLVLPTGFGHDGETLYLHGSTGALSLRSGTGLPVCVTVTLLDGVVYARSTFNHTMNYRSAVVQGTARLVTGEEERLHGLRAITEHLAPGSWDYCRPTTKKELAATAVLALDLHEASVKMRAAPPEDEPEDVDPAKWAGVLPVRMVWGPPEPDELVAAGLPLPAHLAGVRR